VTPNSTAPAGGIGADRQSRRILILLGIFVVSLILVVGLKMFFSSLYDQLGERSNNERARLFIGEQVVNTLLQIEKDVYQMTTLTNAAAQTHLESHILRHIDTMRRDLKVLRDGGVVKHVANLNIEGQDQMVRQVTYHPDPAARGYVMELIEIDPLLDQLPPKLKELIALLDKRNGLRETADHQALIATERVVATHMKRIPPYFFRLNENANRLFYESSNQLLELEQELTKQRQRFKQTELLLVLLILGLSTLAGWYYTRQISAANRRMETALEEMRLAKEEAERASRSKSEFVSRMSHELRTPMNAILGFAQLLEEEELPEEHRDYVGEINRAGGHLLELINQVLDLAKIEAGHMTLEEIEFDLLQTVDDVAGFVAERARQKGLKLHFFAAPDLPTRVIGDPTRLRQILINLVGNAEKFTAAGNIEIRVELQDDPANAGHPRRIAFSVKDSGIGMDAQTLAKLFKPFVQADESMTRRFGGTGLGLTISKDLIQAMGGKLEVESTPDVGSRFWFTLPIHAAANAPLRPTPLSGYNALLACSDAHQVEALNAHLRALGAEIVTVNASEEIQRPQEEKPDAPWLYIGQGACLAGLIARQGSAGPGRAPIYLQLPDANGAPAGQLGDALLTEPYTYTRLLKTIQEILTSRPSTPSPSITPPAAEETVRKIGRAHILLVEDNRINQMVASRMLEKLGITCDISSHGGEALQRLAATYYDLVLMDMEMPEMDGMEASRAIRASEADAGGGRRIPIIAMTANAMAEDKERCLESGMDDYLAKPVAMDALKKIMTHWLDLPED
jgi:signal transduction histidine kinase/CheY-like chemotaxis protein